jgi:hypothetical protein
LSDGSFLSVPDSFRSTSTPQSDMSSADSNRRRHQSLNVEGDGSNNGNPLVWTPGRRANYVGGQKRSSLPLSVSAHDWVDDPFNIDGDDGDTDKIGSSSYNSRDLEDDIDFSLSPTSTVTPTTQPPAFGSLFSSNFSAEMQRMSAAQQWNLPLVSASTAHITAAPAVSYSPSSAGTLNSGGGSSSLPTTARASTPGGDDALASMSTTAAATTSGSAHMLRSSPLALSASSIDDLSRRKRQQPRPTCQICGTVNTPQWRCAAECACVRA